MFENWPNDLRYNTTIIITNDLGDQKGTKTDLLLRGGIPLDRFTIKTMSESGEIVVRLPKKISRVAKFFLDRATSIYCKLSSKYYYQRSPLVEEGLEIGYKTVTMFFYLVKDLYTETAKDRVVGNLHLFLYATSFITSASSSI